MAGTFYFTSFIHKSGRGPLHCTAPCMSEIFDVMLTSSLQGPGQLLNLHIRIFIFLETACARPLMTVCLSWSGPAIAAMLLCKP